MGSSSDARTEGTEFLLQAFRGQQAGAVDVGHISHGLTGGLRALTGKYWAKGLLPEWLDNGSLAGRPASHITVPDGLQPKNPAPGVFPALRFGNDCRSAALGREGSGGRGPALVPLSSPPPSPNFPNHAAPWAWLQDKIVA